MKSKNKFKNLLTILSVSIIKDDLYSVILNGSNTSGMVGECY